MSWDRYETESIVKSINSLWPQSKPLSDAQVRLLQDKMPGSAKVALEAIDEVAAEREQTTKPGIGTFVKKAEELVRNTHRLAGKTADGDCTWCGNRRVVQVHVWQLSGQEATELGLRDNMVVEQRGKGGFLVDPRLVEELGLQPTTLTLGCGHCDWHDGCLTIGDFAAYYRHFWRYAAPREEEVGERCIGGEQPEAEATMTLPEFLEHEDVGEDVEKMLEKARKG